MYTEPLGLNPFLEQLEATLDELSHEQIKTILIDEARTLSPAERFAFLNRFQSKLQTQFDEDKHTREIDYELQADVNNFVEQVKSGMYCDGWGWDDEIQDERVWGDESWTDEMDDLFNRAEDEFFAGNVENAGKAYETLLELLGLSDEPVFSGQEPPEDMIGTDVSEAKARYFRCLYEVSTVEERVPCLVDALERMEYIGSMPVGVQAMCDTSTRPLDGFDEFLPEWINMLKKIYNPSKYGWGRTVGWLLREAVRLSGGIEGLAELAREEGNRHPDVFFDWVQALVDDDRNEDAVEAAELGVSCIIDLSAKAEND